LYNSQLHIICDENENHIAVLYCTVCCTNLCFYCSEQTHSTRTLAKHRRVPISEKPQERPRCPLHPSHVAEFTCLQDSCHQPSPPLMCFVCKDYGTHKNHKVLRRHQTCLFFLCFTNINTANFHTAVPNVYY